MLNGWSGRPSNWKQVDGDPIRLVRFRVPSCCFEGQPEVELPVASVRIELERLAKFGLGFRPSTPLVELEGPVDMIFRVVPVIDHLLR